jgi:hypothetical protein
MGELFQPTHLLIFGMIFMFFPVLVLPPYWMIFKKAGFSPWLALLILVPFANLLVLYIVAFSVWNVTASPQGWPVQQPPYPPSYPPQV